MYNDKYIKAKMNLYSANFYGNRAPREKDCYTFLSVILLESVVNIDKKYFKNLDGQG